VVDFQLTFSFLVVEMEYCQLRVFNVSFSFLLPSLEVFTLVAISLLNISSTACQSPSACMIARSSVYTQFLETLGKYHQTCKLNDDWFDTSVDESLEDLEDDTQQRYRAITISVEAGKF